MPFYQLYSLLYVQRNLRLTYTVKVAGLSDQLNVTEKGIVQGFLKVWSRWWTLVLLIEIWGTVEKIKASVWIYYIWDFLVTLGTRTGNDLGIISIYYRWCYDSMNERDHLRESQSKKTDGSRIEFCGIPVSGELRWRSIHEESEKEWSWG